MTQGLNLVGWIACVVYSTVPCFWLLIHPRADKWRLRKHSPYLVLLPAWFAMWITMILITAGWRGVVLYHSHWPWTVAAILFASGAWLYRQSSKGFGANQLSGIPELRGRSEQRLVTNGIRAHVRHPVYLGHLCEMLAWSIGTGLAVCFGLTAFAMLTGAGMIRMEDAELEKRFGEEYRQYRLRVSAVFPSRLD